MNHRNKNDAGLTAAMLMLAPVLVCQGMYVRRVTPKLPEADGARRGEAGQGSTLGLLILGDSAAAGVGVPTQDGALTGHMVSQLKNKFHVRWKLEAQTGATTRSTIARLKASAQEEFQVAAISLGVNDVTSGRYIHTWRRELQELAGLLRSRFGIRRMLWSGLPPMHEFPALPQPLRWYLGARARQFDRVLRMWTAAQPDCELVAAPGSGYGPLMAEDGFHPGPKMYELWGAEMAGRVTRLAAEPSLAIGRSWEERLSL